MSGWEVLYQAVLLVASVVLAAVTWVLAKETRLLRRAQTDPHLSVWIEPHEREMHWIDMLIENIGAGPARNVEFLATPDFECFKDQPLSRLGFMKKGLPYLAPRQRLRFFLTNLLEDFETKMANPFDLVVRYQAKDGKTFAETFRIDFSPLRNLPGGSTSPLYDIAKKLEDMRREISELRPGR
jgi:hypothetical protein